MLTAYALFVMTPYLINVWKLNITRAAAIVNVFSGVATIMPIGMAFLVDAFMGDYWMLLLSSLAYSFVGFQNFPHFFCVYTMLQVLPIFLIKSALVIFIISPGALYSNHIAWSWASNSPPYILQQCRKNNQGATLGISSK